MDPPSLNDDLEIAIENIPNGEKQAYKEALCRCPQLIEEESDPKRFLAFDHGNSDLAAHRLVAYWETRKQHFGSERAFLPMNALDNGTGALSHEDLELFQSGFAMLLPEDQDGRAVLFQDRGRLSSKQSHLENPDRQLRCLFYLMHIVTKRQFAEFVAMTVYGLNARSSSFDRLTTIQNLQLLKVFPVQLHKFHLILLSKRPILDHIIPVTMQCLQDNWPDLQERAIVQKGISIPELLMNLKEKHRISSSSLPKIPVGGAWTLNNFKKWQKDQTEFEKRLQNHSKKRSAQSDLESEQESQESINADNLNDGIQVEEILKRRATDAVYARRKRFRRKIELEVMHDEVIRQQKQNDDLKSQGVRLQALLDQAKKMIKQAEEAECRRPVEDVTCSVVEQSLPASSMGSARCVSPSNSSAPSKAFQNSGTSNAAALGQSAVVMGTSSASFPTKTTTNTDCLVDSSKATMPRYEHNIQDTTSSNVQQQDQQQTHIPQNDLVQQLLLHQYTLLQQQQQQQTMQQLQTRLNVYPSPPPVEGGDIVSSINSLLLQVLNGYGVRQATPAPYGSQQIQNYLANR